MLQTYAVVRKWQKENRLVSVFGLVTKRQGLQQGSKVNRLWRILIKDQVDAPMNCTTWKKDGSLPMMENRRLDTWVVRRRKTLVARNVDKQVQAVSWR